MQAKIQKIKGPFPEYTLWYAKNGELIKFKFTNPKDKKEIITQRNNWKKLNENSLDNWRFFWDRTMQQLKNF